MFSDFLQSRVSDNSVEDWLIALAITAGSIVISRIFYFISTKAIKPLLKKARGTFFYIITDMLEEPLAVLIIIGGFYYAQRRLHFEASVDAGIGKIGFFLVILIVTWAIARLIDNLISQYLVPVIEKSESKLDDQLLPILRKVSSGVVWIAGTIVALDYAGYNVGTIIAGLGIGGLAFAFAAQETIANLFGGITVFVDAPFRIGDRIKIIGYEGWVREIGLRTAKLETLDGRRLTMPNSLFSKNVIENVSSEQSTRVVENVSIACDHKSDTIERALKILKETMAGNPNLDTKSTAWFAKFGESSWDINVVLWIKKGADYSQTLSEANLSIVRAFEKAKIGFALPTRVMMQSK